MRGLRRLGSCPSGRFTRVRMLRIRKSASGLQQDRRSLRGLQKAYIALAAADRDVFGSAALAHSASSLQRAELALKLADKKVAVRAVAARLEERDRRPGLRSTSLTPARLN